MARSKVGTVTARILDETTLDVLVDLEALAPRASASLTEQGMTSLQRRIMALAEESLAGAQGTE